MRIASKNRRSFCTEEAISGMSNKIIGEPIHSETECVAAPFLRIVALSAARLIYRFEDRRMYQARAGNFNPLLPALKRFDFTYTSRHGLGERKIVRAKLDCVRDRKVSRMEKFERAFEIGDTNVLIDMKSFDLVKLRL